MKIRRGLWIALILATFLILIVVGIKTRFLSPDIPDIKDVMEIMNKKLEVLSRMRINLLKSVEAEKLAVMADTDESSRANAAESRKAAEALEKDRLELGRLIRKDPRNPELELFQEFDRSWQELRKVDQVLLDFAVENTNLKAANLSFTKGSQVLKGFEEALDHLISNQGPAKGELLINRLVCSAKVAGIKIHYLHAPHIAAADDKQMDNIEKDIKENEAIISRALTRLAVLIPEKERTTLQKAKTAFGEFSRVTAEVIDLSRKNTNIKSFELSLGRKRKITAQCDEILKSLEEVVRSRSFKATR